MREEGEKHLKDEKRTAALITLNEDVGEFEDLARSARFQVEMEIIQRRNRPHPSTFVGRGKLEEIKELLRKRPVDVVIINGDLKPSQHYLLENELKVECIDRIRLVLEIFATRAFSREAQLQVQRAKLRYEIPLLREWIHNAKGGEHPGFLGSGEYETDAYYELIRRQLSRIEEELVKLANDSQLRRRQRHKRGFHTVALAGYTNAGKSTLLNVLTSEEALVEDRMFSTLSTTTGRLEGVNKPILLTDTIGFLHDLPHFMIESFKSTLDEIYFSDLVLLVVDSSDDLAMFKTKLRTSMDILFPDVDATSLFIVLSKADKASDLQAKRAAVLSTIPCQEVIAISSLSGSGLPELHDAIVEHFQYPVEMHFFLPYSAGSQSFISWLHDHTEMQTRAEDRGTEITLRCRESDHAGIVRRIVELGGRALMDA